MRVLGFDPGTMATGYGVVLFELGRLQLEGCGVLRPPAALDLPGRLDFLFMGATRLLEVAVTGAPDAAIARDIARSIAASSLVKAAIFGADPNWGRVLATVGARAGSQHYAIDPHKSTVAIQGVPVFARGEPVLTDPPALRAKMRKVA